MAEAETTGDDRVTLDCAVCRRAFTYTPAGRGRPRKFCSADCRARSYRPAAAVHAKCCVKCGAAFTASKPTAAYCSQRCRESAKRARERAAGKRAHTGTRPWEDRPCRECAGLYRVRKDNTRVFCSDACKVAWREASRGPRPVSYRLAYRRSCGECGERFSPPGGAAYCSERCRGRAINKAATAHKRRPRPCKGCGETFTPAYGRAQSAYCTSSCAKRTLRRIGKAARKARIRKATVEPVDPIRVFERDGWRCHLCGGLTIKAKRGSHHPKAPELDHVVPLSKGGEHSYRNTACAHRACNIAKSDRIVGQPSLLAA